MDILFINSVSETLTNPSYSRHRGLQKVFSSIGNLKSINLYQNKSGLINNVLALLNAKSRIKKALSNIDFDSVDVVVLTTISILGMKYIKKICVEKHKTLIIDCVEWASPEEKKLGKLSPSYIHNVSINERLIDKNVRVISISSYFEKYFVNKGIKTVVVPNLIDINEISFTRKTIHPKIELLFAGYPQKKDAINVVVEGILELSDIERGYFHLTIAGITRESFFEKYNYLKSRINEIDEFTTFLGKVPADTIKDLYVKADFSVLLRNDRLRVCQAGFPTKLLDSFKNSTPIIANITSDIGKYLINKQNGFVVDAFSTTAFSKTLKMIITSFNAGQLNMDNMCHNAFNTCVQSFNYLNYVDKVKSLFINE